LNFTVATVGDNCIDRYLPPVGMSMVGGNAVNVAVQLKRLGLDSAYFGAVGGDDDGRRVAACVGGTGVDVSHLRVVPEGRTAYTVIATDARGERRFVEEEFGVCRGYRPNSADMEALLRMRHVHLGWLDDDGDLKRRLVAAGVSVSQDLSVNADPRNVDPKGLTIAFVSSDDSSRFELLLAAGARTAVVMRGEHGAIACDGCHRAEISIKRVSVRDTTGAGDSFIAGFIAAQLRGDRLEACLESGRENAAETCQHLGGFPQEPQGDRSP
jgi:fructoselysine 6-kinase